MIDKYKVITGDKVYLSNNKYIYVIFSYISKPENKTIYDNLFNSYKRILSKMSDDNISFFDESYIGICYKYYSTHLYANNTYYCETCSIDERVPIKEYMDWLYSDNFYDYLQRFNRLVAYK